MLHLGVDIGSKTIKIVVLDEGGKLLYDSYDRHLSNVKSTLLYTLRNVMRSFPETPMTVGVTGSAGMQFASLLGLDFVQEVVACRMAIKAYIPQTDVAIEIGGEDSKILFLTGGEELRMNSTCAGGTGGFIDTIAGMLDINAEKLNYYARGCRTIHPIASRCAVFAQSDVRPLLNQGVSKDDIAGSVLDAVAVQCITGLACGRPIKGTVAFLGGPLHFLSALRDRFKERLELDDAHVIVPTEGHLFVAFGAALSASATGMTLEQLHARLAATDWDQDATLARLPALFESEEEYREFSQRHARAGVARTNLAGYEGVAYLGVDSGSEAIKYALIAEDGSVLRTYYKRSAGNLVEVASDMLIDLWKHIPRMHDKTPAVRIAHATVTGYGEAYLKQAFSFDSGEVETVAHMEAARAVAPDVDFILDIGGQDVKCLYLRNGQLENVVLNEACSSGCGALLSGMAWSMNVKLDKFLHEALFAKLPVDLGSRCTVFMTSRVRHAQKAGASVGDISAGLAYSVVRNAVHKVIRVRDFSLLGKRVVVQGGTFLNDAVLRAFERLSGREVVRPDIAGHMGAYGAALLARSRAKAGATSSLLDRAAVEKQTFMRETKNCELCSNRCALTTTVFDSGGRKRVFTVGNRCDRGASESRVGVRMPNLFKYRFRRVFSAPNRPSAPRGRVGVLRALDMYEYFPFWEAFLSDLGFEVVLSDASASTALHGSALETVPSESVCFPAKLAHVHIANLVDAGVERIFAPMVKSAGEAGRACPVAAGYPFVLGANVPSLTERGIRFVAPCLDGGFCCDFDGDEENGEGGMRMNGVLAGGLRMGGSQTDGAWAGDARADGAQVSDAQADVARLLAAIRELDDRLSEADVSRAIAAGRAAQSRFRRDMTHAGRVAYKKMRAAGGRGIVLAGRPYHVDPALHHAIPSLLGSFGYAVFTEDSLAVIGDDCVMADGGGGSVGESIDHAADDALRAISHGEGVGSGADAGHGFDAPYLVTAADDAGGCARWEFADRIVRAAEETMRFDDLDFVELVSFGCGIDAVTVDRARDIVESAGRVFTSLKIDEMVDLASTRIRVRSMIAAQEARRRSGNRDCANVASARRCASDSREAECSSDSCALGRND